MQNQDSEGLGENDLTMRKNRSRVCSGVRMNSLFSIGAYFLIYLIISFIVSKCSKNAFRNQTLMLGTTKHPLHPKHPIAVEPRWSKHMGTTSLKVEVGYSQNRFEKTDVFKRQTRSKTPAVYHYGQVQVPLTPS